MRTKNAIAICAVLAASSIGLAAPASADPSGTGCPEGFDLLPVKKIIKEYAAPGFDKAIKSEDRNEDGLLCIKILPPAVDFYDPTFFYQDNDFPVTA
ncbi:hypothetical protein [Arthrobacter nitrophenolicus]|uniref:Uncharacterized protein n=1 Tax=Arthrobacter nitrophenolicus TaxID=683150 RepID=A0A4R5YAX9_9MICC|nr:hypothetical protein [Arthrobacter nitrophenolicus]TDL41137.1 hypothetical protein E2R57_00145 [Arthrobacter nitrophenolicus]